MPSGVGEGLEAGKRQVKPGCLTIAEASREFIATVVTSWVIVPFFFRSQWSSGVRSPVFFSAQGGYVQKLRLHICEPVLAGDLRRDSHFSSV